MPRQTLKQRKDGRYRCKLGNKYFYGSTPTEALRARSAYEKMLDAGMRAEAQGMTVEEYARRWVETYKAHLTDGPYNTHVRMLNRFCEHRGIGEKRLKDVTTMDVQDYYNTAQGMSYSYICDMRDSIKGMFRGAIADRLITYDPTLKATLPKGKKGTHRAITPHERELIAQTQHRIRPAVMVMLYAGLRRGEVLALNIDRDVDFSSKKITVREAVQFELNGQPTIVDPKTEAGKRTIPLLDVLADELKGLHGLIAEKKSGGLMSESSWRRAWESYLVSISVQENGCPRRTYNSKREDIVRNTERWIDIEIRPHDLRHSYCTMLYDAGVDLKTAQKWMGHGDEEMTMRIYTHLSEERELSATEALENAARSSFRGQIGGQCQNRSDLTK